MRVNKFLADRILETEICSLSDFEKTACFYRDKIIATGKMVLPTEQFSNLMMNHLVNCFDKSLFKIEPDLLFPESPTYSALALSTLQDVCTSAAIMILRNFKESSARFVFATDFFSELHNTSLVGARYSDLVVGAGTIKLPYTLTDHLGDEFDEFMYFIGTVQDYFRVKDDDPEWLEYQSTRDHCKEKYMFSLAWKDSSKAWNYTAHYCTDPKTTIKEMFKDSVFKGTYLNKDNTPNISEMIESDGYQDHIRSMFNCLIYLKSGDPDLRKMKNEIKRKSPESSKIIRKDKDLSEHDFTVVGFGFKKNPNYSQEFYYQSPYWARRGLAKVWTWCKGSLKKRKDLVDVEC